MEEKITARLVRIEKDDKKLVVEFEGKVYRLPALPFQVEEQEELSEEVYCLLDREAEENTGLTLDYDKYIREKFSEGDEADFRIISTRSNYYELRDVLYGLKTTIQKQNTINPALTTLIRCRIIGINGKDITVKHLGSLNGERLKLTDLYYMLLAQLNNTGQDIEKLCSIITADMSHEAFAHECRKWLLDYTHDKDIAEKRSTLLDLRGRCFYAIGESILLSRCDISLRSIIEARLSNLIEQTGYYLYALKFLEEGKAEETVQEFLTILKKSGYHYHPNKWFSIVLNLFLLDYDMMIRFMPEIINVLRSQDMAVWRRTPINSLWVELLEHFIRTCNHTIYRETSDEGLVQMLISALLLQLSINDGMEYSIIDDDLNRATLYRLAARQNVNEPQRLLNQAFKQITGTSTETPYLQTRDFDVDMLANMLSNQLSGTSVPADTNLMFEREDILIDITGDNITVSRSDADPDVQKKSMLSKLGLAHGIDVLLEEKLPKEYHFHSGIPYYKLLWKHIDSCLFKKLSPKQDAKRSPHVGDVVNVIVLEKVAQYNFRCQIIDDDICGEGMLNISSLSGSKDFAPYTYIMDKEDFYLNGSPLLIDVEVREIDEDDTVHFTMSHFLDSFFEEYKDENISYDTHLFCCLNSKSGHVNRFPAVSLEGLPLSVGFDDPADIALVKKGMVVEVEACTERNGDFYNVTFVRVREDMTFNSREVLHRMLLAYTEKRVYVDEDSQKTEQVYEMEPTHMKELMRQVETLAALDSDREHSYNYLAFCRLIATLIADEKSSIFYNRRMALLEMLYDFEKNNQIREENLSLLSEDISIFGDNAIMRRDFKKMNIISWLGRDGFETQLYECSSDESNPELQQLAQLVLSFNFVNKAALQQQADAIRDKIRTLMKLQASTTNKRYYGQEDDATEFKTSIVFPAGERNKSDVKQQTVKILQEICAFLNAKGGKLYLGVNDAGYETGLTDDMKAHEYLSNRDKYRTYIDNSIASHLGQEAAHYTTVSWDKEATADVLIISIEPCPHPVSIEGRYYERMGTSARLVNEEYQPIFLRNRRLLAESIEGSIAIEETPQVISEEQKQESSPTTTTSTRPVAVDKSIRTSSVRNNVLHDYEEDYEPVASYIYFTKDWKYKVMHEDRYEENDYSLTLAVHHEEVNDYLILAYANGKVAKVRLKEVLERQAGKLWPHNNDSELIFASVAKPTDCVVLGLIEDHMDKQKYLRIDSVDSFEVCNIQQCGEIPTDVGICGAFTCDLVDGDTILKSDKNMPRTSLGLKWDVYRAKQIIEKIGLKI